MITALAYLQLHIWKNHFLVRIRRLRQPKYLFGAMVGALYFYAYFFRHLFSSRRSEPGDFFSAEQLGGFEMLGAFVLFLVVLMAWVLPKKRAALNFNEAEIAFLFTAPIPRRALIHYKLLSAQVGLLFTSILLTAISGRFKTSAYFWMPLLAYWLLFATMSLHFLAASFLRTMLLDRGLSSKRWRVFAVLIAVVVFAAMAISVKQAVGSFNAGNIGGIADLAAELRGVFATGITPYLLMPFQMLLRPLFTQEPLEFLFAVAPVLLVFVLQYIWVLRMNVAFEEASVEHSRKRAELMSAVKRGDWKVAATKPRRAWFKLSAAGNPFIAIFWKNLISMGQAFQRRTIILIGIFAFIPIIVFWNAARGAGGSIVGFMSLMFLFWSVLIGPALMRQDFRQDFVNSELLKLFPMRGWQIALGELLTPVVVLSLIQWFLISVTLIFLQIPALNEISILTRSIFVVGLALLLPLLNVVMLTIPNLAVLLFPAWFQVGRDASQGIEATGQRLILMLGQFLVVTIALLPLGVCGGIAGVLGFYAGGITLAIVFAAIAGGIILGLECALMIWWLGKIFEKLDLAKESSS